MSSPHMSTKGEVLPRCKGSTACEPVKLQSKHFRNCNTYRRYIFTWKDSGRGVERNSSDQSGTKTQQSIAVNARVPGLAPKVSCDKVRGFQGLEHPCPVTLWLDWLQCMWQYPQSEICSCTGPCLGGLFVAVLMPCFYLALHWWGAPLLWQSSLGSPSLSKMSFEILKDACRPCGSVGLCPLCCSLRLLIDLHTFLGVHYTLLVTLPSQGLLETLLSQLH